MLRSFHSRIALAFACLMITSGGLYAGMEWMVLTAHRQKILERVSRGWSEDLAGSLAEIGREDLRQIIIGTGVLVLLILMVGLGIIAVMMRGIEDLVRNAAALDDILSAGGRPIDDSVRQRTDDIAQLAGIFNRMAERLAVQSQYMRGQDRQCREMVATVSHELRTPMTSMQGYLETLLRKSGQLSAAELRHYLEVAVRQSRRMGNLAQGLFELAKLEADDLQPNFERFPMQELIQDVAQKFGMAADAQGIHIIADFLPDIPAVYADIGMIERVLSNLVDNALRHTPKAGNISLQLAYEGEQVSVSVRNTGTGIAEEHLAALFEHESPLRYSLGNNRVGLGLPIASKIIRLHGGVIEVTSAQCRGTIFIFRLPAVRP